jgi:hypothetical protein
MFLKRTRPTLPKKKKKENAILVVDQMELNGFKVKFAEKSHVTPPDDHLRSSVVVNSTNYVQLPSLILGEKGKKRFELQYSNVGEFKPGRRTLSPPSRPDDPKRGKRYIAPRQYENLETSFSRGSFAGMATKRSDSTDLPVVGWTRKMMVGSDGELLSSKVSEEYSIEKIMNRKQSTSNLSSSSMIKNVEHQPNFFAEGGLIPGSTMRQRGNAPANSSGHLESSTLSAVKRNPGIDKDKEEVLALTVS